MPSTVKTSTETTARDELPEPFTKDQRKEIDHLRGTGMISAVGEYTPSEFWELLDAYDALRARCEEYRAKLAECEKDAGRYHVLIGLLRPGQYIQMRNYDRTHEINGPTIALFDYSGKLLGYGATEDEAVDAAQGGENGNT